MRSRILSNFGFAFGRFTPTYSNNTNVAATTAYPAYYFKVFNLVFAFGLVDIDPTAAAPTTTRLYISGLPFTGAFVLISDAVGLGASQSTGGGNQAGNIYADAGQSRVIYDFAAQNGANLGHGWAMVYTIK